MDYNLRPLIEETARSLGMHPTELAAIISYETGGTFDPVKAGPVTEWGQHRGLIQWGEPQAKKYGVDWNDPLNSQLGANGAIARYFKDRGWRPGMSLTDAYSIVNAGAPGRYNASDAGNGGAPGTVADKVRNQFGPHIENAMNMFSDRWIWGDEKISPPPRPNYEARWNPDAVPPPRNPFRGLSPLETGLAMSGFKQDANKAPIENIWSAIQGRHMSPDEMLAVDEAKKKQGGFLGGLFSLFGGA